MKFFFVKSRGEWVSVEPGKIVWISKSPGKPNYIGIHTMEKTIETKMSLKRIQGFLDSDEFMKIHKSFIVRMEYITSVKGDFSTLRLGEKRFPISRTYASQILENLQLLREIPRL